MTQALLIIDMQSMMQQRIDEGRPHVNGTAGDKVAQLAQAFRAAGLPVIHIRHGDETPGSPLHPDAPGLAPMPCGIAKEGEAVFYKSTSSGFASTDLEVFLRAQNIEALVATGAVAGYCVTSTVRAGADLGFNMTVVSDAVLGFGAPDESLSPEEILHVSLALLQGEFAHVERSCHIPEGSKAVS